MPVPLRRLKPVQAEVYPILESSFSGSGSTSSTRTEEFAYASNGLWTVLSRRHSSASTSSPKDENGFSPESIPVAVEWTEDRRLGEKGKRKSLVVWVKQKSGQQPQSDNSNSARIIHIPAHLLPPYSPSPLYASLHIHQPIELSLAILQPVIPSSAMSASIHLDVSDFDLTGLYPAKTDHLANGLANGTSNGNGAVDGQIASRPARIIRQGETITLPRHSGSSQNLRILLLDPVQQGILTSTTRIIITTTPHVFEPEQQIWRDVDGMKSESSHGRTHLSMADFDPDTFLSSSLDLHFTQQRSMQDGSPTVDGYGSSDLTQSISSSTSGSITPRPNGHIPIAPPSPPAPLEEVLADEAGLDVGGTRFSVMVARGPSSISAKKPSSSSRQAEDEVCWMGVGGLGRAGIFEGDWVLLRAPQNGSDSHSGRLVKAVAWERLDEDDSEIPANPIVLSPYLSRSIFPSTSAHQEVIVSPTSFGARRPALPIAKTIAVARIATAEGVDKRYERSWLRGLRAFFETPTKQKGGGRGKEDDSREDRVKMIRRGDVISVPIWIDKPLKQDEELDGASDPAESSSSDEDSPSSSWNIGRQTNTKPTSLAYFSVTSLSYEPLVPLEEDFRSSASSKARAGELGCWVDVGNEGSTRLVLTGVEKARIRRRGEDRDWQGIEPSPPPFSQAAYTRLRNLLVSCLSNPSIASALQLSILVKGARGSGKTSLIRYLADEVGYSVVLVDAYEIIGDTPAQTEGAILAAVDKASSCSPTILLIKHVEALARKAESGTGKVPPIVKVLEDALGSLRTASGESGWPSILVGTTGDVDAVPGEVLGCFKQEIEISAPNEPQRQIIARYALRNSVLTSDVSISTVSTQSAALQAADIVALVHRAQDIALRRVMKTTQRSLPELRLAGLPISAGDLETALADARASYSDSIGAPKIPNVRWEDVGGLANVKKEILETVQLPLERPELFAEGLKKRSGILLYGPPGTGKTLLAKAVATSCSLNFFSVKGPELLNMYIGESEANVRRVFQRARDASPCIIFMDELDSVAPKRGNQGDSGGVMDRIVSQLLAELDGMSKGDGGGGGGDVFVMGATNRPDLLDPALLRPGRFDRMLYLSVATDHTAQLSILQALTRKFKLAEDLDLAEISEMCPFNLTGADFYALCSDAMLRAMTRKAEEVDQRIEELNASPEPHHFPHPLTPQYYLSTMAQPEEIEVRVSREDFVGSLEKLNPSVSVDEMRHYERVQQEFRGYNIGQNGSAGGDESEDD